MKMSGRVQESIHILINTKISIYHQLKPKIFVQILRLSFLELDQRSRTLMHFIKSH